jgi:hypothetical protein
MKRDERRRKEAKGGERKRKETKGEEMRGGYLNSFDSSHQVCIRQVRPFTNFHKWTCFVNCNGLIFWYF